MILKTKRNSLILQLEQDYVELRIAEKLVCRYIWLRSMVSYLTRAGFLKVSSNWYYSFNITYYKPKSSDSPKLSVG